MIGRTISHYTITAELGRGGMGVVYRADDDRLGRSVAIKVLPPVAAGDPEAKDRFIQEARAASAFDHPNICSIYDIGETPEGELYLVMPVYEGGTLRDRMEAGPMQPETAVGFARQIASGVGRAHAKGIVHRDIKPDNLMVLEDDRLVILDFGVAKLAEGLDLTSQGSTIGTAAYMSPEQARGDSVDGRSDLWALGAILYEALAGRRPFPGSYDQAVIYGILNSEPKPLDGVPEELAAVVMRLLAKDPEDRYESGQAVIEALAPWGGGFGSPGERSRPSGVTTFGSRRALVLGGVALVLVLAVAAVLLTQTPANDFTPDPAIAVLPFRVEGPAEIEYLGRGLPRLLSASIDGVGDLRAVDPVSVLSVLGDSPADVAAVRRISNEFNAEGAILGSVIQVGSEIRLQATVYGADGTAGATQTVSAASPEALPQAVDNLSRALIAQRLSEEGAEMATLSALSSQSFDALRHYLEAEKLLSVGEFDEAYESLTGAIEADSLFAMAYFRRSSISGWGEADRGTARADIARAAENAQRLPLRARLLISAQMAAANDSIWTARARWRNLVNRYPDDSHATGRLGDNLLHYNAFIGRSDLESIPLLRRALRLFSSNEEARIHLLGYALRDADWEALDSLELKGRASDDVRVRVGQAWQSSAGDVDVFFEWASGSVRGGNLEWESVLDFAILTRHPEVAIRASDSTATPEVEILRSAYAVLLGRPSVAKVRLDEAGQLLGWGTEGSWFMGINPVTYHPDFERFLAAEPPWDPSTEDDGWPAYLHGLRHAFLAEFDAIDSLRDTLAAIGTATTEFYVASLDAIVKWNQGDRSGALAVLERDLDGELREFPSDGIDDDLRWTSQWVLVAWLRAELLLEAGRLDDARNWYKTFHQLDAIFGTRVFYAAPAHRRLAEIAELQGDEDEAIHQYERFLRYWYDVDSELQPAVDEARARLDALLDARGQEPRE